MFFVVQTIIFIAVVRVKKSMVIGSTLYVKYNCIEWHTRMICTFPIETYTQD